MDIAELGVSINPQGAVTGKEVAVGAAREMATEMKKAGAESEKAMAKAGDAAEQMGKDVKAAAEAGEKAVEKASKSPAYERIKKQAVAVGAAMKASTTVAASPTTSLWDRLANQATMAASKIKLGMQMAGREIVTSLTNAAQTAGRAISSGLNGTARTAATGMNLLSRAASTVTSTVRGAASSLGGFRVSLGGLVAGLTSAYFAVQTLTASLAAVGSGFTTAGEVQRAEQGLTTLMGQAKLAKATIDELRATSRAGGIDLGGSLETVTKFSALGFTPADAVKLNKSIAEIAGTIGLSSARATELGNALAQVQSKGVVSMEELRQQIAEKGIPVMDELAKKMGVTTAALGKMVEEGKVPAKQLVDIFLNLEGGFAKFAGGIERATTTLPGALARLKANFADVFGVSMFSPINEALVPLINRMSTAIGKMGGAAEAVGRAIGAGLSALIDPLVGGLEQVSAYLDEIAPKLQAFSNVISQPGGFKLALEAGVDFAMDSLRRGLEAAGIVFQSLMERGAYEVMKIFQKLTDASFWSGLADALYNAAVEFVNVLKTGILSVLQNLHNQTSILGMSIYSGAMKAVQDTADMEKRASGQPAPQVMPPTIITPGQAWDMTKARPGAAQDAFAQAMASAEAANMGPQLPKTVLPGAGMSGVSSASSKADEEVKKAKGRADQLKTIAERYVEASLTPIEKYNATIAEIDMLAEKNYLTADQRMRARTKAMEDYTAAVQAAASPLAQLLNQWGNVKDVMQQGAQDIAQVFSNNIGQGLTDLITGAKSAKDAFADMGKAIVNDLARIAVQMLVNYAIQKAIGFAVGAISGTGGAAATTATTTAAVAHTGGLVSGSMPNTRTVDSSAWGSAPRFQHGGVVPGLGSGEVPAVMEPGEQVLTRDGARDIRRRLNGDEQQQSTTVQVTNMNITDMSLVEAHIAKNPNIILNVLGQRPSTVRRMLQIPTKMNG